MPPSNWRLKGTRPEVGRDERPTIRGPYVPRPLSDIQGLWRQALLDRPAAHADRFFETVPDEAFHAVRARLVFPARFTVPHTLALHEIVDWRPVPPDLAFFAASLCEVARKALVPLYVSAASKSFVAVAHAVYGPLLTPVEWGLIRAWANIAIERKNMSKLVKPAPATAEPGVFLWTGPPYEHEPGEPIRRTPRGILRDMRGR